MRRSPSPEVCGGCRPSFTGAELQTRGALWQPRGRTQVRGSRWYEHQEPLQWAGMVASDRPHRPSSPAVPATGPARRARRRVELFVRSDPRRRRSGVGRQSSMPAGLVAARGRDDKPAVPQGSPQKSGACSTGRPRHSTGGASGCGGPAGGDDQSSRVQDPAYGTCGCAPHAHGLHGEPLRSP